MNTENIDYESPAKKPLKNKQKNEEITQNKKDEDQDFAQYYYHNRE